MVGDLARYEEIVASFDSEEDVNVRSLGYLLSILAVLGGAAESSFADEAIKGFGRLQGQGSEQFLNALMAMSRGEVSEARRHLDGIQIDDGTRGQRLRALEGWAMILEGDTLAGIDRPRGAIDSLGPPNLGGAQLDNSLRLTLARALAARAETRDEGLRMLRYGFDMRTAPDVYAIRLIALAQALEAAGDIEGASIALADFVNIWQNADPRLQPRVEAARADLERLNAIRN